MGFDLLAQMIGFAVIEVLNFFVRYNRLIKFCSGYQYLVSLNKGKVMGRNTSVSLGNYFEDFVQNRIAEGRYKNASEVIRAGLRLLEEEENKVQILKNAVQEGIDSGLSENFDPKKHLETLKANKRING
ncbi:type II toxin-antitoxin system ParD family antitoxin [Sphingobacterium sp. UT-1RO-CII-1]|uniref:type II toxin-antitoxin system ParD family antitoxin n=1 Tax=Sphingobacterium sp. UT-1RO-CII-1 TaxID=2995225 RepID=UPI00227A6E1D|nr:type II toxin-antitoxin system ParD family antitoxin [Sphingobacterium sp. UT-1RO-CII-1]MCY4779103.1 type II toxin-antitoxin system ParD family antitoxin [Sphingobacterium sp. UT-1RO-CII-1]